MIRRQRQLNEALRQIKRKENWKEGKEDGLFNSWHENGQKADEIPYKNGKTDGLWTQWYENGKKQAERHRKDGKSDGLQTEWDENGNKTVEIQFKDGAEVSRKEFHRS